MDGQCAAHILHREVEAIFDSRALIKRLHSVSFSTSMSGMSASIKLAIHDLVSQEPGREGARARAPEQGSRGLRA
eukprot:5356313-Pyramimonas_sp.AAC.1